MKQAVIQMSKTPNTNDYRVNGYDHPEKVTLRAKQEPLFSDDKEYQVRQAKSKVRGLKLVIKDILTAWQGKDKSEKIGKDLFKLNSQSYEAEQELERLTKGD